MNNLFISIAVLTFLGSAVTAQGFNPYHSIIKGKVRQQFTYVNEHKYDEILKGVSDETLEHAFAGDHSLGGKRHDKVNLKKWFERLGTVLPDLKLEISDIQVKGGPNNTLAIVRWKAT